MDLNKVSQEEIEEIFHRIDFLSNADLTAMLKRPDLPRHLRSYVRAVLRYRYLSSQLFGEFADAILEGDDMAYEDPDTWTQVAALYRSFLDITLGAQLTLDDALVVLGQFVYATSLAAYATYDQHGTPYPQGRLLHMFGNILHGLAHVPPSMDPQGDAWMHVRDGLDASLYDGGPLLTSMPVRLPWDEDDDTST
jgi:hypothetical protein